MSVISEGIRVLADDTLSFGNYKSKEKIKVNNFNHKGNVYELRTHDKMTRLSMNGNLLFESVPGATVHSFFINSEIVKFDIEGIGDSMITLGLLPNLEYKIIIDDVNVGATVSNISGKINFSTGVTENLQSIIIEKV